MYRRIHESIYNEKEVFFFFFFLFFLQRGWRERVGIDKMATHGMAIRVIETLYDVNKPIT